MKKIAAVLAMCVFGSFTLAGEIVENTTYKSPYCGCCSKWIEHMRAAGFDLAVHDAQDNNKLNMIKEQMGIPVELQSCHSTKIGNYFIEGHVPAEIVRRLLTEADPEIVGIAAPGMPAGANVPGMEVHDRRAEYSIYAKTRSGETIVYETVR